MRTTRGLERDIVHGVNTTLVEPLIHAGFGSPRFWPTGLIVLETYGRRSGRTHSIPLLATKFGDLVVVSTMRSRQSQMNACYPHMRLNGSIGICNR